MMPATLYAIVPVLNEAQNVSALMASFDRLEASVAADFRLFALFVDDGSSDGTGRGIQQHKGALACEVLRHDVNRGPGAAFATGFSWLQGRLRPDDWVITMEGDATSKDDVIVRMLVRRREGYDVVLASPYLYGGGFSQVHVLRILTSHLANGLVKIVLGIGGILTFSSFLRLYRGTVILDLQKKYGPGIIALHGFESMVELLGKLVLENVRLSEVEMRVDWSNRKGKSKMRILRTTLGYLRLFARWGSIVKNSRR